MTDGVPTSLVAVLIGAVTALSGVIAYLWRYYSKRLEETQQAAFDRDLSHAKERESWAIERATWSTERGNLLGDGETLRSNLRAEFEVKHRALAEDYAKAVRDLHESAKIHETQSRREFASNVELVSERFVEAASRLAAVLDKYYDRIMSRRKT